MSEGGSGKGPFDGALDREAIVARIRSHPIDGEPAAMRSAFARLMLGADCHGHALTPFDSPGARTVVGALADDGPEGWTLRPRVEPSAEEAGADRSGTSIVWFHGGGYVFGSPETHARAAARLAGLVGVPVRVPRYPLAPEHRWPAQLEHALGAVDRAARGKPGAQRRTGARARVVLAGDSAGGHLALVTALALARRGTPAAGLLLFAPNTDRTGLSDTRRRMTPLDPMNDDEDDRRLARLCFGDLPDDHPHVSPVLDDLALLPPTHVEVGEPEVLLGDATILHERARALGARVELHVEPGLLHMGQLWAPYWDAADASLARAARAARGWLRAPMP